MQYKSKLGSAFHKGYTKALYKYPNMLTQITFYFRLKKQTSTLNTKGILLLFIKEKFLKYLE